MYFEGPCDTEDWSNGCWKFNFAIKVINNILKYIKIENCYLYCINCNHIFEQMNAALVRFRDFF